MRLLAASLLACALLAFAPRAAGDPKAKASLDRPKAARAEPAATGPWWMRNDLGPPTSGRYAGMWNETLGEHAGMSLSGVGEGAAAPATAVRMGAVATVGHGEGGVDPDTVDNAHSRVAGSYTMLILPKIVAADYQLAPEAIQRVVRQNYGRFNVCYEAKLRTNPALAGGVAVKFAIDRTGTVAMAQDRASDLPDPDVVSCIVRAFANLAFPPSADGYATVVYALSFRPEG
jgi:hypothetical protein